MPRDLETILDAMKEENETLRQNGAAMAPSRVAEYLAEILLVTTDYRGWLDEETAIARSKRSRAHWRGRFPELLELGMAKWEGQGRRARRMYRACIVPVPANLSALEADARAAARRIG